MDASIIQRAFEARETTTSELRALAGAAAGREMTAEERQSEERMFASIADYDRRIKSGLAEMDAAKEIAAARDRFDSTAGRSRSSGPAERRLHPEMEQLRRLAAGEVKSAEFMMARPAQRSVPPYGGMVTSTDDDITRPEFSETLWETLRETSTVIAGGATVLRTTSGEDIRLPVTDGHSAATIVGEASPITPSDPTFDSVTVGAFKYAWLTDVSYELLTDDIFDLVGYLARDGGLSMGNGIGSDLLTGGGGSEPTGAVTAASAGKTLASSTALTADELIDAYHSVTAPYRRGASWVVHDLIAAVIRKLKNEVTGDYLWQSGLQAGMPDTILGRPVITDPAMPSTVAPSNRIALFGDLRGYVVRFAGPMRIERSDEFKFDTDQSSFRFLQRADGVLRDKGALKVVVAKPNGG